MPLTAAARIADQTPRIAALWRALLPLRSCVSFMNTGAHPDDETSAMLAALGRRGFDLSCACSTRGEGGQNDIGRESGATLGALRTNEMERAAKALNLRLYWLSDSAQDTITDFGFSKSGEETLAKWGRDRTLARFVHILRRERPDVICPTFLDVPGQHGHHRAMTKAAHEVMDLVADPGFQGCDLPPWQVKKLFLPAWSGAGQAYDDDLPPPPATTVIHAGTDPITGFTDEQAGQQSRVFHATQAMGRWVPAGTGRNWPLHLADCRIDTSGDDIAAGLPQTLADLAARAPALAPLDDAQARIDTAFADILAPGLAETLARALDHVRAARNACPDHAKSEVLHRLIRKEAQLATAIRIAAGVQVAGYLGADFLHPGETVSATFECDPGQAGTVAVNWLLPDSWSVTDDTLTVPQTAPPHDAYRDTWLPDAPDRPALRVTTTVAGIESETCLPLLVPPVVLPTQTADLAPRAAVINLRATDFGIGVSLSLNTLPTVLPGTSRTDSTGRGLPSTDAGNAATDAAFTLPEGWSAEPTADGLTLTLPDTVETGLYTLPLTEDGQPLHSVSRIVHSHIAPTARVSPAELRIRVLDVVLPNVRIAYFGGGNDRVDRWLTALGLDVTTPDPGTISDADLERIDTVVIGIFALRFRAGLAGLMPRLHDWVERGGTLVTLYHRPWDNWDPATTPPKPLEIGQPSLRWRVTDETARVTHAVPDHPLLSGPNPITEDTWAGWHKERGLYFAKSWDPAYAALLEMADPDEPPHRGALLSAEIGNGRHTHTSLILHHQMEHLVPGAFALMANLCAKR